MVQEIRTQPTIFGALGKGLGQGLSESIPKEVEYQRLRSGLQNLANKSDQGNLSPAQFLAQAAGTYGATPQIIQSFGELAKQQNKAQSLSNFKNQQGQHKSFPNISEKSAISPQASKTPSLTQEEVFAQTQKGYIEPSLSEQREMAAKLYNQNPGYFGNDPQNALNEISKGIEIEKSRQSSFERQHEKLSKIQDNVVSRLRQHAENLGAIGKDGLPGNVPANVYSEIENKAVQAAKSKSEGGGGKTEQQVMKDYGSDLDEISREYEKIKSVGGWGIVFRPAKETLGNLQNIQDKFEKRDDTRNLAHKLIKEKFSPKFSYAIAEPVKREPSLSKAIKSLPIGEAIETGFESKIPTNSFSEDQNLAIAKKLAPLLGKKGSPLAVAYELEKRGYDPSIWLQYLRDNKYKLGLGVQQDEQLDIPNNLVGTINDWWLQEWSGI